MAITDKSRKILWGRSGNRCAICKTELVFEKDPFNEHLNIGEECHIVSRQPNGPRHKLIADYDYDNCDNLLLLCCNHHKTIDERINDYPETRLKDIKNTHENWVKENLGNINNFETETQKPRATKLFDFIVNKHDIEMNKKSSKQIFESQEGFQIAFSEIQKIKEKIKAFVNELNSNAPNYRIVIKDNQQHICDIIFKGHTLLAQCYQKTYGNTPSDLYLFFAVVDGIFNENGYADVFYPAKVLEIIRLDFAYNDSGEFGWRNQERKLDFYTSEDITDIWMEKFFKKTLK